MPADLAMADLLDYTDWERGKWRKCLRRHSEPALEIGVGPHGHARFQTIGDLVRHIFLGREAVCREALRAAVDRYRSYLRD